MNVQYVIVKRYLSLGPRHEAALAFKVICISPSQHVSLACSGVLADPSIPLVSLEPTENACCSRIHVPSCMSHWTLLRHVMLHKNTFTRHETLLHCGNKQKTPTPHLGSQGCTTVSFNRLVAVLGRCRCLAGSNCWEYVDFHRVD